MGRIEKTIFIIDYISNESLRRRIQRGLNKGEAVNALASFAIYNSKITKGIGVFGNERWLDSWNGNNSQRNIFYIKGNALKQ